MKKNTVSLLEAIKKKISKIDDSDNNTSDQSLSDEFEYVEQDDSAPSDEKSSKKGGTKDVSDVDDINIESSIEDSVENSEDGDGKVEAASDEEDGDGFDLSFDDGQEGDNVDFGDLDNVATDDDHESIKKAAEKIEDTPEEKNDSLKVNEPKESDNSTDGKDESDQEGSDADEHLSESQTDQGQEMSQDDFDQGFEELSQQDEVAQNSNFLRQSSSEDSHQQNNNLTNDEEIIDQKDDLKADESESHANPESQDQNLVTADDDAPEDLADLKKSNEDGQETEIENNDPEQSSDLEQEFSIDDFDETGDEDYGDNEGVKNEISDEIMDGSHFEVDENEEGLDQEESLDDEEEFKIEDVDFDPPAMQEETAAESSPKFTAQPLFSVQTNEPEDDVDQMQDEDQGGDEGSDINFDDLEDDLNFDENDVTENENVSHHSDDNAEDSEQVLEKAHDDSFKSGSEEFPVPDFNEDFKATQHDLNVQMESFLNSDAAATDVHQNTQVPPSYHEPDMVDHKKENNTPLKSENTISHPDYDHEISEKGSDYEFHTKYFAKNRDAKYKTLKQIDGDISINSKIAEKVSQTIKNISETRDMIKDVDGFVGGGMLSHVAFELMKPKLEKWLEANLPNLVENVVRQEIKKIISEENK